MTLVPECILAREAEMCYLPLATVTDFDVWADKPVSVDEVVNTLNENSVKTKRLLEELIPRIPKQRNCECKNALKDAIL
jgi:5'-methylthioadenosine phosphorylase